MKKYIVLSVNSNVDYLYFTPLVCWAWRKFGWGPIVFFQGTIAGDLHKLVFENSIPIYSSFVFENVYQVDSIPGYRSDTITQISRLYGACALKSLEGGYLMTGDIDMLPLSDYWKPKHNAPTVWGHDLTGFTHFPICYIGMQTWYWTEVMHTNGQNYNDCIKRDLDTLPQAKDPDFYKYWFSDQDLITARLKAYGTEKIDFINRGQGKHGYARGRVDRGSGGWVLDQPELIDAHLEQQTWQNDEKIKRLLNLLHTVWPQEDWKWFIRYTMEFKKLAV